jgi:choline dehydrogenase-like flavoprotein
MSVVMTPSCINPDPNAGFRAHIMSIDPNKNLKVLHEDQTKDIDVMRRGVLKSIQLMESLKENNLVGNRLLPPLDIDVLNDKDKLMGWIKNNHWTVFHWTSTCKAGLLGDVADEKFRLRGNIINDNNYNNMIRRIVSNIYVGSAACLPEIPEANPHLTITAFSIALSEELLKKQFNNANRKYEKPVELVRANINISKQDNDHFSTIIRRSGEESPKVCNIAKEYSKKWDENHFNNVNDDDNE